MLTTLSPLCVQQMSMQSMWEVSMNHMLQEFAKETVRDVCGDNVELAPSVERIVMEAYLRGRGDTLAMLGIEEDDLPAADAATAWTA